MNNCFVDTILETKSQIVGTKYITKILLKYNETIETISINHLFNILNTYKVSNNSRFLAYGSIKYILSIILKKRNDIKENSSYKLYLQTLWKKRSSLDVFHISDIEENAIKQSILFFTQKFIDSKKETCKSIYYTSLAILLTLCTNLRSAELQQLTIDHIYKILKNDPINIHIKKRKKSLVILHNKTMLQAVLNHLELVNNHNQNNYKLINISTTCINDTLKKQIQIYLPQINTNAKYGIQAIRKINTTILIEYGSILLAQKFNRHLDKSVTMKYYNTNNYITKYINKIYTAI
uniref:Tyr recombinase domain-containing protein n=1 Tax=Faxonius propinquus nudivirus TaxID=3139431 RepID=A0AAU8GCC3_9VIRU